MVRVELSLSSKVVLLASSAGVLVHVPFDVTILVLESAGSDLEQTHRHARTNFCQLDALVSGLDEDVVATGVLLLGSTTTGNQGGWVSQDA